MKAWEYALEHRSELLAFWTSPLGETFAEKWGMHSSAPEPEPLNLVEAAKLRRAAPLYVSDEMMDVWMAAAESFPGEPLYPDDVPFPAGFVLLPRGLEVVDGRGQTGKFRAFAWCTYGYRDAEDDGPSGIHLSLYVHADDEWEEDWDPAAYAKLWGSPLNLYHACRWGYEVDYTETAKAWQPGSWTTIPGRAEVLDDPVAAAAGTIVSFRQLQTFFRLVQQEIAHPRPSLADRAIRKRAARLTGQKPTEVPDVMVVTLRRFRPSGDTTHESPVDWSHRWLVNGHWRHQPYPSLGLDRGGKTVTRLKWIAPYVKGPDDKPLVLKDRAYQLIR